MFVYRVAATIALMLSCIYGLWYIALPIGLAGLRLFPWYAEFVVAGFFFDALYGMADDAGLRGYAGTIVSAGAACLYWGFRRMLR